VRLTRLTNLIVVLVIMEALVLVGLGIRRWTESYQAQRVLGSRAALK
jgi:hypothetical protein